MRTLKMSHNVGKACVQLHLARRWARRQRPRWLKLRFLNGPALLARNTCGQGHVLLCLVDVQAKQLLLVSANIIPRKALDNAAERAKIEALNTMSGRSIWFPRIAAVFDSSGEAVSVCTQGSTSNKQFGSEGGPVLVRMACQALVHARKATSLN